MAVALFLVFLPYALQPNGFRVLSQGLAALGTFSEGTSPSQLLASQISQSEWGLLSFQTGLEAPAFFVALYASFVLIGTMGAIHARQLPVHFWQLGGLSLISVIGLNLSFITSHYWTHYTPMFVPFAMMNVLLLLQGLRALSHAEQRDTSLIIIGGIALTSGVVIIKTVAFMLSNLGLFNAALTTQIPDKALYEFLQSEKKNGRTFLVTEKPIYHVILNESRAGDGHPAMLEAALSGTQIGPISQIDIFDPEQSPCTALLEEKKDSIIITSNQRVSQLVYDCLRSRTDLYTEERHASFILFRKISP
jgi:hypothetical protein